jgi:hypothetical protein
MGGWPDPGELNMRMRSIICPTAGKCHDVALCVMQPALAKTPGG